ncbi:MAG TPA: beta-propeller fold lactonase family protein [Thermoguttaceae bacterium]|nr:beta-propeller fold lactonase family protein [Thermoguttaceae bacterium]
MKKEHFRMSMMCKAVCILAAAAMSAAPAVVDAASHLGPTAVAASQDGKSLFVANTDGKQVAVVDVASGKVSGSIAMPAEPTGLVLSPDGATLYVTCAAPKSTVCMVDVKSRKITGSIPAGHTATGAAISPDGKFLYVCNRFDNNVSVIDLAAKKIALVPTVREPVAAAITPDGKSVFVMNHLPIDRADGYDVATAVTVIDTENKKTSNIRLPNGSSSGRGICVSPDGKYAFATHILARYQMPTTQLERGWMNTNALSIIDAENRKLINTVLLDDVDLGAANPWGVACTADGARICVTHAGTHELSIIDAVALMEKLAAIPADAATDDRGIYASSTAADVPNDLAFLVGNRRRIRLQGGGPWDPVDEWGVNGPRGLAVIGSKAYVACCFSDNLVAVDLEPKLSNFLQQIPLGPKPELTVQHKGEILFNSASICFQHWQCCASCHPDARVDALNWDLMNDGLGNPKNVKSMLLAHRTPPSMSSGIRATAELAVRSGIEHIQFAVRPEEEAVAIDEYLKSLEPVPSPYLEDGKLSAAAERGKAIFFDKEVGCSKCHPEPLYTDMLIHDVASKGLYDRRDTFDTPTLIECWRTAPYMHDGQYTTMKELFIKGKHGKKGGNIDKLNEQQVEDLVEFVLSL